MESASHLDNQYGSYVVGSSHIRYRGPITVNCLFHILRALTGPVMASKVRCFCIKSGSDVSNLGLAADAESQYFYDAVWHFVATATAGRDAWQTSQKMTLFVPVSVHHYAAARPKIRPQMRAFNQRNSNLSNNINRIEESWCLQHDAQQWQQNHAALRPTPRHHSSQPNKCCRLNAAANSLCGHPNTAQRRPPNFPRNDPVCRGLCPPGWSGNAANTPANARFQGEKFQIIS